MATGLIALLDDVAAIAKLAAASADDVAASAAKAGTKAAGIVIDDAAVTPRYVVGLASDRELPIVRKIAIGSLKNKLLILLPGALLLSYFAPWAITPLLMLGGAYLCLEGFHKVAELIVPHEQKKEASEQVSGGSAQKIEDERVAGAIRTDVILSAEITAISLAGVSDSPIATQATVLAVVGVGMTVLVYGAVALIVKADDAGVAMARSGNGMVRSLGMAIVQGMPAFLTTLGFVGMLAMLWVGGGITVHGLQQLGYPAAEEAIHHVAVAAAGAMPAAGGLISWFVQAGLSGILGVAIGWLTDIVYGHGVAPLLKAARR